MLPLLPTSVIIFVTADKSRSEAIQVFSILNCQSSTAHQLLPVVEIPPIPVVLWFFFLLKEQVLAAVPLLKYSTRIACRHMKTTGETA